jgi:hypothetical protein
MSLPFGHASFDDDNFHCPEESFSLHRRRGRDRISDRGQILPFVAVCLAALMGFAGLAVDLGYIQYQQRQQQSATDAAAIAGAQALITNDACPDNAAAQTAAENDSASNGFTTGSNGVTVTATSPPSVAAFSGDNCAVQTTVRSTHPTWFSKWLGFAGTVSTTAIAVVESRSSNVGCLYVNGDVTASGLDVDAANCGVVVNGSITCSGCTFDTDYLGYIGSVTASGDTYTEATPSPMLPAPNPCPDISGCYYLTNNPPATSPCTAGKTQSSGTLALTPGCYDSMILTNVTVTLSPGLYVLNGIVGSGDTFTGSGITIYEATGGFTASGASSSLSACTTSCTNGAVSGVLFYQPTSNTDGVTISGTSSNYSGLVYAPTADVTSSGAGTGYVIYIIGSLTTSGSDFTDTAPTPAPSAGPTPAGLFIKTAVLAY